MGEYLQNCDAATQRFLNMIAIPTVTTDEQMEICSRISNNKASIPDGIPNRDLKLIVKLMYEGIFAAA